MKKKSVVCSPHPHSHHPQVLAELGLAPGVDVVGCFDGTSWTANGGTAVSVSPTHGPSSPLATIRLSNLDDYDRCMTALDGAKAAWAATPAPARGEAVRRIGDALRLKKKALGALIAIEMGKLLTEGEGEVQEFIDVCDMACGLSRSLEGKVGTPLGGVPPSFPCHCAC